MPARPHVALGTTKEGEPSSCRLRRSPAPSAGSAMVSGHSLRAGLATTAALAGRSDRAIMLQGRWKSRTMVDRYVRTADAWRENAAAGLL